MDTNYFMLFIILLLIGIGLVLYALFSATLSNAKKILDMLCINIGGIVILISIFGIAYVVA